jgi:tyrosinase
MLDRFWWIWQMQDPDKRIDAWVNLGTQGGGAGGGHNHGGVKRRQRGGSAKTPEESVIDLEWLAPSIPLTAANDQLGGNDGKFCYVYV